ncbi:MAG: LuxR C-terminal-related transcriptional regulator [Oscillibacter sp.]|nr:LuxR C-terminal-related transcriptional regulator [Oscillibacter sp.]
MNDKLLARPALLDALTHDARTKKLIWIHTPTGWGKTTLIAQYFAQCAPDAPVISLLDEEWQSQLEQAVSDGVPHIALDDFQELADEEQNFVGDCITQSNYDTRFYLLSRAALPAFLKPFALTGQLAAYSDQQLALSAEEAAQVLALREIPCGKAAVQKLTEEFRGWCVGIVCVARRAMEVGGLTPQAWQLGMTDIYDYFDVCVWNRLSSGMQRFLLQIGHLESFTEREVCMVCGRQSVGALLDEALHYSSGMIQDDGETYHMLKIVHSYLEYKQKKLCDEENRTQLYDNTALYFALTGDMPKALYYYHLSGNRKRITELLLENANSHPGDAYFVDLEQYYLELDEDMVSQSPEMLCAIALLHSLSMRVEESERYRERLKVLEHSLPRSDRRKKIAAEKLAFLSITLPHGGSGRMVETLKSLPAMGANLRGVSITGNMPGIMNGGMDFCQWSKKDRLMYKTMRPVLNAVFGSFVKGMPEVALGESLFEKSWDSDLTESLMLLNSGKAAGNQEDYQQVNFAANGLMARMFVCQNRLQTATELMEQFREQAEARGKWQLLKNVDAFLFWLNLLSGDENAIDNWMKQDAPNELEHFYILERYRYLMKVKGYIVYGSNLEALSLLSQVEDYFTRYKRTYNYIEARLLRAIVLYRSGSGDWESVLRDALTRCEEFGFIRIVSDLGAGIFELLQKLKLPKDSEYYSHLMAATRQQTLYYPRFLAQRRKDDYGLTETEKNVLRLLCAGMSNAEICKLLNSSMGTVKTHTGNIYTKLEVKGRLAAVKLAEEQGLV